MIEPVHLPHGNEYLINVATHIVGTADSSRTCNFIRRRKRMVQRDCAGDATNYTEVRDDWKTDAAAFWASAVR